MSNVILIGYMGCGKSTVGRRLSFVLKHPYLDTDKMIENKQKMSINEIFAAQGEESFRSMETACIRQLFSNKQDYVIAVGGGLPLREENRRLLHELGTVIYLRANPETIYDRLKTDTTRPLLRGEDPFGKIQSMIAVRGPVYEETADFCVDVDGKSFERILREIKKLLKEERQAMKLLVINGPNLNFLGIREPEIYGKTTYKDLEAMIAQKARETGCEIEMFQSNHEGAIIDRIQQAYFDGTGGIVINPGAYTHYSYAIHDALASVTTMPKVEIHISDITKREGFRSVSVTKAACDKQIYGHGLQGYFEAIDEVISLYQKK